ncbi:heparinase II/III family protein [Dongia deserti]|uniref:heparinase II/III family protein n=1 Tax=Dongia deserti TaxID=2268030 RepID=UPI000E64C7B3|nr:heparinase II/III family protein [Dongia deserti]
MTALAETLRKPSPQRARRGNRRPKLLAPRLQTLFALPPKLLAHRAVRRLLQPLYRSRLYGSTLGKRSSGELAAVPTEIWPADSRPALALLNGEFHFGADVVKNPKPLHNPLGATEAWQRQMANFVWLDTLRAFGGVQARQFARHAVLAWFTDTAAYDSLTWSSDVLAARLRRCLLNSVFLETNTDALFRAHLLRSLNRQAEHLSRALPDGLNGSDLLKACIALMLAGALLPQGEKWLRKASLLLDRELHAQILPDGGHVERSPSVMLDLLQHLLDLHHALALTGRKLPDQLIATIGNLASALKLLTHPDGGLALFNDSTESKSSAVLLALMRADAASGVEARDLVQLPHTGFQRMVAGRSVLISDTGAPPPHGLDSHAHAGTLSFEFSHGGERMIVNCGAHPTAAEWRQVQRATAAHSTLVVDDTNSSMLLPPDGPYGGGLALTPRAVVVRREATGAGQWLDARHNGYEEPFDLVHRRRLFLTPDGLELIGEETLTGRGGRTFALRFHLHPNVQVSVSQSSQSALLKLPQGGGWRLRVQGGDLSLADSIYLGQAGAARRTQQLVVQGAIEDDTTQVKWALQKESAKR